jgi:hypothetical protein
MGSCELPRSKFGQPIIVRPVPPAILRSRSSADKEHAGKRCALWTVGTRDDLEAIQRYARGAAGMPEKVREQAVLTVQAIQGRP